jgi:hypothetical protein
MALVTKLERINALELFKKDLHGARGRLKEKRYERGWRGESLDEVKKGQPPIVQRFLDWEGGKSGKDIFPHQLPWENMTSLGR